MSKRSGWCHPENSRILTLAGRGLRRLTSWSAALGNRCAGHARTSNFTRAWRDRPLRSGGVVILTALCTDGALRQWTGGTVDLRGWLDPRLLDGGGPGLGSEATTIQALDWKEFTAVECARRASVPDLSGPTRPDILFEDFERPDQLRALARAGNLSETDFVTRFRYLVARPTP